MDKPTIRRFNVTRPGTPIPRPARAPMRAHWSSMALLSAVGVVSVALPLSVSAPADAHAERRLTASILSVDGGCFESGRICWAEGKVRIFNRRPQGSGKIGICVGIDVVTADGRSISLEPPSPHGQAVIALRPGTSGVTTYKTLFDAAAGEPDRVQLTHVHKHVVSGGTQC